MCVSALARMAALVLHAVVAGAFTPPLTLARPTALATARLGAAAATATPRATAATACEPDGPPIEVGQRVEGMYGASRLGTSFGCKWFGAEVTASRADGTFDLRYDDGDSEERVLPKYLRPPGGVAADEDWAEPEWLVALRARSAESSDNRLAAMRTLADRVRPLEDSLGALGVSVRLVDKGTGLPITPDSLIFLAVLTTLQIYVLRLLLAAVGL